MGNMAQISDFISRLVVSVGGGAWVQGIVAPGDRDGVWIFNSSVDRDLYVRYVGGVGVAPSGVPSAGDADCVVASGQTVWHPVGQSVGVYLAFSDGSALAGSVVLRETK